MKCYYVFSNSSKQAEGTRQEQYAIHEQEFRKHGNRDSPWSHTMRLESLPQKEGAKIKKKAISFCLYTPYTVSNEVLTMHSEIKELVQLFSRNSSVCPQNPFKDHCNCSCIEIPVLDTIYVRLELLSARSVSKASQHYSGPATAVTTSTETHSNPTETCLPPIRQALTSSPGIAIRIQAWQVMESSGSPRNVQPWGS